MELELVRDKTNIDPLFQFIAAFPNGDSVNTKAELLKAIDHTNDFVLIAKDLDRICGVFVFMVEPNDRYIEMLYAFSADSRAYDELFSYLFTNYKSYQLDVVIKSENSLLTQKLHSLDALFYPAEVKLQLDTFCEYPNDLTIVPYREQYRDQYLSIHQTDGYWTGDRVLGRLDLFQVFLAVRNGTVVGYLDAAAFDKSTEPYDLFVAEPFRNMGYGKALVNELVKANLPKSVFLFVETDNLPALKVYRKIGFIATQERIQTITLKI